MTMPNYIPINYTPNLSSGTDYTANDCVGIPQQLPERVSGISLETLGLTDMGDVGPALRFLFFSAPLTGTWQDNVAAAPSVADGRNFITQMSVLSTDWLDFGASAKSVGACNLELALFGALWYVIVADSAWNAVTNTDLNLCMILKQAR